jgi:hypothetical protein
MEKMMIENAKVKLQTQQMYTELLRQISNFPKNLKFSIGCDLRNSFSDLRNSLNSSLILSKKETALRNSDIHLENFRDILWTAKELRCISLPQYGKWIEDTVNLGKMIGGWLKSLKN